jgi:hypothetical protein
MSPFDKRKNNCVLGFTIFRVWLFFLSFTQNVLFSHENKEIILTAIFACFLCIISSTASSAAPQIPLSEDVGTEPRGQIISGLMGRKVSFEPGVAVAFNSCMGLSIAALHEMSKAKSRLFIYCSICATT